MSTGGVKRFIEMIRRAKSYGIEYTVIENIPPLSDLDAELNYESVKFHLPLNKYEELIFFRLLTWIYTTVKMTLLGISLCKRRRQFDLIMTPDGELFCMALSSFFTHLVTRVPLLFVVQAVPSGIPSEGILQEYSRYKMSDFGKIPALSISIYAHIIRTILVRVYNAVPLIIAVSKSLENQLKTYGVKTNVRVIGNGVDLKFFGSTTYEGEKEYDAIFIGRYSPEKGIFNLINVWKKVTSYLPDAILLLAGYSTRKVSKAINEKIKEYGLNENVIVRGVVLREKVLLLKKSKLFLFLSEQEAAPLAPAEALACGLPIICYDIPPMRELYNCDSVIRCKIGDICEISNKTRELLSNEFKRRRLGRLGRKFVSKFNWETVAEEEAQIYRHVCAWKKW